MTAVLNVLHTQPNSHSNPDSSPPAASQPAGQPVRGVYYPHSLAQVCVVEAHVAGCGGCADHDLLQGGGGVVTVQLKGLQEAAQRQALCMISWVVGGCWKYT